MRVGKRGNATVLWVWYVRPSGSAWRWENDLTFVVTPTRDRTHRVEESENSNTKTRDIRSHRMTDLSNEIKKGAGRGRPTQHGTLSRVSVSSPRPSQHAPCTHTQRGTPTRRPPSSIMHATAGASRPVRPAKRFRPADRAASTPTQAARPAGAALLRAPPRHRMSDLRSSTRSAPTPLLPGHSSPRRSPRSPHLQRSACRRAPPCQI
jgi:hypothetical protein